MGEIAPGSSASVQSTLHHVFVASFDPKAINLCDPPQYAILPSIDNYSFGPAGAANTARPDSRLHPKVKLLNTRSTATSAKFRSMVPDTINIWYENRQGGVFQGSLTLGKEYTINTYEGHVFYFTNQDRSVEYARFTMRQDQVLYVIRDPQHPAPQHMLDHEAKEEKFMAEYEANNHGVQWRHYFGPEGPRAPPSMFMWPAAYVGQMHQVRSTEGYWSCRGPASLCQSPKPVDLKLETISIGPRAYVIENFLSDFEAEEIINIADPMMKVSTVGNKDGGGQRTDSTRTSRNAWVGRKASVVTESLFVRAEHLLKVERLDSRNTEDMQVVHYQDGQKYDSHHDWGVSGYPQSRYITLLLYLTDMENEYAGGETSFPKAADGKGIKVHPGKGNAVLFYNLLPDGNGDDLALHAALPVRQGEKWLANFWVWDPHRR